MNTGNAKKSFLLILNPVIELVSFMKNIADDKEILNQLLEKENFKNYKTLINKFSFEEKKEIKSEEGNIEKDKLKFNEFTSFLMANIFNILKWTLYDKIGEKINKMSFKDILNISDEELRKIVIESQKSKGGQVKISNQVKGVKPEIKISETKP
jgi:L-lactate utilization protein LutC